MSKLKLTYFDFQGGRGEPPKLALSIGGIPFEDDRVPPAEWEGRKTHNPFGALPVLEREGQVVAQSNAINCYVGKQSEGAESSAVTRKPGCHARRNRVQQVCADCSSQWPKRPS